MKQNTLIAGVLISIAFCGGGCRGPGPAFPQLHEALSANGWGFNRAETAKAFQRDRQRLGKRFGTAVVKYTQNNSRRAYWCACFLVFESYLFGNDPDITLALRLLDKDIKRRLANELTHREKADLIRFHVLAAVLAYKDNQLRKAGRYKKWVTTTMSQGKYAGVMPALPKEDRALYDAL